MSSSSPPPPFPSGVLHLLLGVVVLVVNVTLLLATFSERRLRTGGHYLAANMWTANSVLGAAMAVQNVVNGVREHSQLLATTEGTAALLNCLATLATLLSLSTARLVWHRSPQHSMSAWSALKISLSLWAAMGLLIVAKSVAFALLSDVADRDSYLFGFEAAILTTFVVANVVIYSVTLYLVVARVGSAVHDCRRPTQPTTRETATTVTTGLWLLFVVLSFAVLALQLAAETMRTVPYRSPTSASLFLAAFSVHAVVNPVVALLRDADLAEGVRRVLSCDRLRSQPTTEDGGGSSGDPPPPYMSRLNSASNSLLDQQ